MVAIINEKVQNWLIIAMITMLSACVGLCAGNDLKHYASEVMHDAACQRSAQ